MRAFFYLEFDVKNCYNDNVNYRKERFMKRLSKNAATLFGEYMTKLQCDGSSSYACGGGADF